ncbi:MAG TPA: hypothetical protein VFB79_20115, partial [Candidatus Angelobacter sp.]|nr:hypothetical protein [Candidatus Angelobacter sp.]
MKKYWYLVWACFLLLPWACFGQSQEWLDISSQEREIKEVPGEPGAPAIQLYYADVRDDNTR